jgi:hypothetical protein
VRCGNHQFFGTVTDWGHHCEPPVWGGPFNAETIPKRRHRQATQVVTRQFQRALAAYPGLGIVRERREAVHLLEHTQKELRGPDILEAAEVLA